MKRALYYLSGVYQRQTSGNNYGKLMPVIAINVLGRRDKTAWKSHNFFRHFVFQDLCSNDRLEDLTLIQYSLFHLEKVLKLKFDSFDFHFKEKNFDREKLKEWLKLFEAAPFLKERIFQPYKGINEAYKRIDCDNTEEENP
jgi:hypothetical protein